MEENEFETVSAVVDARGRGKLRTLGRWLFSALSIIMAFEWGRRAYGCVPNRFDKFVYRDVALIWVASLVTYITVAMWHDTGSPPKAGQVALSIRRYAAVVYVFLMVVTFITVIFHR